MNNINEERLAIILANAISMLEEAGSPYDEIFYELGTSQEELERLGLDFSEEPYEPAV